MAQWIPTNKVTGASYPAITDEEKAAHLADPFYATKFRYSLVPGSDKPKASEPVEAKKVEKQPEPPKQ